MISSEIEKQRLDKRYQSIRRTINQNNNAAAISSQESVESSSSSSGEADTSNIICSISTLPQSSSGCSQTNNYNNETVGSTSLAQSTQIEPKQIKKQTVSKPSSSLSVTETTPSTSTSSGSTTTQTMINKKYFAISFIFYLPAMWQRLRGIGEHVKKLNKLIVMLILLVIHYWIYTNFMQNI